MRKIQRFSFTPGFTRLQVMSTYSIQRIVNKLRRNPIEDGAISGFSGQNSVPE